MKLLYFLEYSPGLELNPVSNWTLVNSPIQIEKFKSFKSQFEPSLDLNPGDYGPWNKLNPGVEIEDLRYVQFTVWLTTEWKVITLHIKVIKLEGN